jgi:uracil-DNA glycosylase
VHGRPTVVKGRLVVPMFHPAAALHNPEIRPKLVQDFLRLPEWIEKVMAASAPPAETQPAVEEGQPEKTKEEPRQLSLF